jgi:hypothetical protein
LRTFLLAGETSLMRKRMFRSSARRSLARRGFGYSPRYDPESREEESLN